ncbi:pseudouridine synthase [Clostridium sp. HCP1S3_B4]|uniref:pseudouridine synthase n=1 Tax=unclassified Clostridium TaxID=2614128 RepID=UPI003F8AFDF0
MERLDKIIANLGYGTRKEVKQMARKGMIEVDGEIVKDSSLNIDPEKSVIKINGEEIFYRKYIYLLMNKPAGVISATYDNRDETVIDLLEPDHQVFEPFPVGRLDKDTVGLLFLTNDGELNHRLISPRHHVDKVYFAKIDKEVNEDDIEKFKNGITLDDGYKCKEAKLEILNILDDGTSEVNITIQEGKFHQVKRMFEAVGKSVIYLQRISFGGIELDLDLEEGEYRELTDSEIALLKSY